MAYYGDHPSADALHPVRGCGDNAAEAQMGKFIRASVLA